MILETIRQLGPWSWWIVGLILLALEIVAPGNVFVWFGIAAILTGAVALFTEFGWQAELIIFVVLALVLAIVGRRAFSRDAETSEQPYLNERANRHVGSTHVLATPIVDGQGRVRIDDTNWRITGPDMPSGTRVKVVSADGSVLSVVKAG